MLRLLGPGVDLILETMHGAPFHCPLHCSFTLALSCLMPSQSSASPSNYQIQPFTSRVPSSFLLHSPYFLLPPLLPPTVNSLQRLVCEVPNPPVLSNSIRTLRRSIPCTNYPHRHFQSEWLRTMLRSSTSTTSSFQAAISMIRLPFPGVLHLQPMRSRELG